MASIVDLSQDSLSYLNMICSLHTQRDRDKFLVMSPK